MFKKIFLFTFLAFLNVYPESEELLLKLKKEPSKSGCFQKPQGPETEKVLKVKDLPETKSKKKSRKEKNLTAYLQSRKIAKIQQEHAEKQKRKEEAERNKQIARQLRKNYRHPLSYLNIPVYGPFFTASFLYAKPKIPNFVPAKVNLNEDSANLRQREQKPSFDWEAGWKVGFGLNFNRDQVDFYSCWTSLSGKKTQVLDSSSYEIQTLVHFSEADIADTDFVNHSSFYAKFNLDTLDIELGKSYYAGKLFSLRPAAGFKWAYLKEEFFIFARTSQSEDFPKHMTLPYKYNGYGISLSLNGYLHFLPHLCARGDVNAALLYGKTTVKLTTVQNSGHLDQESRYAESEDWLLKPYFKILLGLSAGGNLVHDRIFLSSFAGWQFELWQDLKSSISNLNDINSTLEISSFILSFRAEF